MPTKNKSTAAKTSTSTPVKSEVLGAIKELFDSGEYEIPDDCVSGKVTAKVDQLEAQIKSLTQTVLAMQSGKPAPEGGRVNALEATRKGK
jgi:hypothetical protein